MIKRYAGPDRRERRDREIAALWALQGRLPVAPVPHVDRDALVMGRIDGIHGQERIEAGSGGAVLSALGRLLRDV